MLWAVAATAAAPGLRCCCGCARGARQGGAGRLAERRGIDATPRPAGRLIWLHAASVGETMSILPVLPELAERAPDADDPADHRHGDVGDAAGAAAAGPGAGSGACCIASCRSMCRPGRLGSSIIGDPMSAGFVESELWPNLLAALPGAGHSH